MWLLFIGNRSRWDQSCLCSDVELKTKLTGKGGLPMRVSLISSAFNSMTQRFYVELVDGGYDVAVELHTGNDSRLCEAVSLFKPDLIIAPFLTKAIPEEIWSKRVCIIVHPGN